MLSVSPEIAVAVVDAGIGVDEEVFLRGIDPGPAHAVDVDYGETHLQSPCVHDLLNVVVPLAYVGLEGEKEMRLSNF